MAEMGLSILNEILSGVGQLALGYAQARVPSGTDIDYPGSDLGPGDPMVDAFFTAGGGGGYRPIPQIAMIAPDGKIGVWMHAGRPMLWSKDFAAVKRVRRLAGKAAARVGRRGGR